MQGLHAEDLWLRSVLALQRSNGEASSSGRRDTSSLAGCSPPDTADVQNCQTVLEVAKFSADLHAAATRLLVLVKSVAADLAAAESGRAGGKEHGARGWRVSSASGVVISSESGRRKGGADVASDEVAVHVADASAEVAAAGSELLGCVAGKTWLMERVKGVVQRDATPGMQQAQEAEADDDATDVAMLVSTLVVIQLALKTAIEALETAKRHRQLRHSSRGKQKVLQQQEAFEREHGRFVSSVKSFVASLQPSLSSSTAHESTVSFAASSPLASPDSNSKRRKRSEKCLPRAPSGSGTPLRNASLPAGHGDFAESPFCCLGMLRFLNSSCRDGAMEGALGGQKEAIVDKGDERIEEDVGDDEGEGGEEDEEEEEEQQEEEEYVDEVGREEADKEENGEEEVEETRGGQLEGARGRPRAGVAVARSSEWVLHSQKKSATSRLNRGMTRVLRRNRGLRQTSSHFMKARPWRNQQKKKQARRSLVTRECRNPFVNALLKAEGQTMSQDDVDDLEDFIVCRKGRDYVPHVLYSR